MTSLAITGQAYGSWYRSLEQLDSAKLFSRRPYITLILMPDASHILFIVYFYLFTVLFILLSEFLLFSFVYSSHSYNDCVSVFVFFFVLSAEKDFPFLNGQ